MCCRRILLIAVYIYIDELSVLYQNGHIPKHIVAWPDDDDDGGATIQTHVLRGADDDGAFLSPLHDGNIVLFMVFNMHIIHITVDLLQI